MSIIALRKRGSGIVAEAPAKINLFLKIHSKRPDGYHNLSTVMTAVGLYDRLTFQKAPRRIRVTTSDPALPTDRRNTVVKAARLFFDRCPARGGIRIHIDKRIPSGSGLGGGSSDAAATLLALNDLYGRPLTHRHLTILAAQVGSDVPFFLGSSPALCIGRGERVTSLPRMPRLHLALVAPSLPNSTAEVYRRFRKPPRGRGPSLKTFLKALASGNPREIGRQLYNDLQTAGAEINPRVDMALEVLRRHDFAGALMTGSGSGVFGLSPSRHHARRHARLLKKSPVACLFLVHSL